MPRRIVKVKIAADATTATALREFVAKFNALTRGPAADYFDVQTCSWLLEVARAIDTEISRSPTARLPDDQLLQVCEDFQRVVCA